MRLGIGFKVRPHEAHVKLLGFVLLVHDEPDLGGGLAARLRHPLELHEPAAPALLLARVVGPHLVRVRVRVRVRFRVRVRLRVRARVGVRVRVRVGVRVGVRVRARARMRVGVRFRVRVRGRAQGWLGLGLGRGGSRAAPMLRRAQSRPGSICPSHRPRPRRRRRSCRPLQTSPRRPARAGWRRSPVTPRRVHTVRLQPP